MKLLEGTVYYYQDNNEWVVVHAYEVYDEYLNKETVSKEIGRYKREETAKRNCSKIALLHASTDWGHDGDSDILD